MDGQLLPLTRAGVLSGDLMVARFVLDEVQGFADATDDVKRRRARRGLETLDTLRQEGNVRLYVLDDELPEIAEVDAKLIALARRLAAPAAHERRPARAQRRAAGRADDEPAQARAGAHAEHRARRLRARRADARRQGDGPGRRSSRRRLDGRRERRPRARRRARSDAPGDVGRADRRRPPAVRPRSKTPDDRAASGPVRRTVWARLARCRRGRSSSRPGGGSRFGAAKQFARLGDVSVLDRAVGVAPASRVTASSSCCPPGRDWTAPAGVRVATGGATRSASVRAGLARVPADADVVVVHDAARPLASRALFARVDRRGARRRRRRGARRCRSPTR